MVSFMIFTASVWKLWDQHMYVVYGVVFNAAHVEENTKVPTRPSEAKVIGIISETESYIVR